MQKRQNKSQPEASAPGNPSIRPASAEEDIVWGFARMVGDQVLKAINRGKRPKFFALTLTKDGVAKFAKLMQHKPSLRSAELFLRSYKRHSSKAVPKLTVCGFHVGGAGHLLAGVEEAFVVVSMSEESFAGFAQKIKRNQGKADLVKQHIVVEEPLSLLCHALGFVDHAPDTKERRKLWTVTVKNGRP